MIVYHFTSADHGVSNIANRRIKVAELDKLNDPFELTAVDTRDRSLRRVFRDMKLELAKTKGIICFSKNWSNPVQWAHYGDRFRGIALGFEIQDNILVPVEYVKDRILLEFDKRSRPQLDENTTRKVLSTKFIHWQYKEEMRGFCEFSEEEKIHRSIGLPIFQNFSEQLQLQTVVLGAEASKDTEIKIQKALSAFGNKVELIKSRLAFGSFSVVRNRRHTQTLKN